MIASDWKKLLSAVPLKYRQLRSHAEPAMILRIEQILGRELPSPYRSFLLSSDGGWIGESRIYGTPELLHLLEARERSHDPSSFDARQKQLAFLPFHPVNNSSFECLDLNDPDAQVVWIRLAFRFGYPRLGLLDTVEPLAGQVMRREALGDAEIQATYTDFLDWIFDEILELDPSSL